MATMKNWSDELLAMDDERLVRALFAMEAVIEHFDMVPKEFAWFELLTGMVGIEARKRGLVD